MGGHSRLFTGFQSHHVSFLGLPLVLGSATLPTNNGSQLKFFTTPMILHCWPMNQSICFVAAAFPHQQGGYVVIDGSMKGLG